MLNDEKSSRGQWNFGEDRGGVPRYRGVVRRGETGYRDQAESEGGDDDQMHIHVKELCLDSVIRLKWRIGCSAG